MALVSVSQGQAVAGPVMAQPVAAMGTHAGVFPVLHLHRHETQEVQVDPEVWAVITHLTA